MRKFTESGYADQESIIENGNTFIFEIGARGTGKTYGTMKYILDHGLYFLYLRRTQTEADMVKHNLTNPFKIINIDFERDIRAGKPFKNICPFINETGEIIGLSAALSTSHNVRGVDFSDIDIIFLDEFIPEKTARPIKDEYKTLLNLFETVNRNRELSGKPPVKLVCCANSNKLDNDIFIGLEIVNKVAKMIQKQQDVYTDNNRDLTVIILNNSPISEKKLNTALYRLTAGSEFLEMAIFNQFESDMDNIRPSRIIEYTPVVKVGELCIYKHKHRNEYYINCTVNGSFKNVYSTTESDLERFNRKYLYMYEAFLNNRVFFEDVISSILFERFYKY